MVPTGEGCSPLLVALQFYYLSLLFFSWPVFKSWFHLPQPASSLLLFRWCWCYCGRRRSVLIIDVPCVLRHAKIEYTSSDRVRRHYDWEHLPTTRHIDEELLSGKNTSGTVTLTIFGLQLLETPQFNASAEVLDGVLSMGSVEQ